jgi:hypothetical protein
MTKDEALKLALLALMEHGTAYLGHSKEYQQAVIESKEALAQPEQEPVVFYRCKNCEHAYETTPPTSCDCLSAAGFERVEYYTAPQRKEWVGLAAADMRDITLICIDKVNVMFMTEDKLKELNA